MATARSLGTVSRWAHPVTGRDGGSDRRWRRDRDALGDVDVDHRIGVARLGGIGGVAVGVRTGSQRGHVVDVEVRVEGWVDLHDAGEVDMATRRHGHLGGNGPGAGRRGDRGPRGGGGRPRAGDQATLRHKGQDSRRYGVGDRAVTGRRGARVGDRDGVGQAVPGCDRPAGVTDLVIASGAGTSGGSNECVASQTSGSQAVFSPGVAVAVLVMVPPAKVGSIGAVMRKDDGAARSQGQGHPGRRSAAGRRRRGRARPDGHRRPPGRRPIELRW